jgi:signal recognition particle subunit SRP54
MKLQPLKQAINPTETLFVVDAMTGQDAVNTAKAFNEKINFDGVVLTKLDGDTTRWSGAFYQSGGG